MKLSRICVYVLLYKIQHNKIVIQNDRLINQCKNGACAVSDEENCCPCG